MKPHIIDKPRQERSKRRVRQRLQNAKAEIFVPEEITKHPTWSRLNDQLDWQDKKSGENQKRYKQIKVAQLVLAGAIPVFALVDGLWGRWITAILGASVLILEGFQQLGQYNNQWVTYRPTAEQLKHEKYLILAKSGPYGSLRQDQDSLRLLAERVEEQVSTEHAKWVSERSQQYDKEMQQSKQ